MKIIKTLLLLLLLGACTTYNTQKGGEPQRNYPVFLQNGLTFAAFKAQAQAKGQNFAALLTLKRNGEDITVKLTGDFAATLLEADFNGQTFNYKTVLGDMLDPQVKTAFEDIVKVLVAKQGAFVNYSAAKDGTYKINYKNEPYTNRYYFKKGLSFPYRLEQLKFVVNKVFTYEDYQVYGQSALPSKITVTDGHGIAEITLTLLSVK